MARLERPKGYSRELWKELQKQIRNIKRFVSQKTKTGARVKNVPDVEDVYTAKGRKKIREWSAKKQWEDTEYVQRETGEVVTGEEARRAWSNARKAQRRQTLEEQPKPSQVQSTFDVYNTIVSLLNTIPNTRPVGRTGERGYFWVNTGGMRDTLLEMLDDMYASGDAGEVDSYMQQNKETIANNTATISFSSEQDDVYNSFNALLTIFNHGMALSKEQWNEISESIF